MQVRRNRVGENVQVAKVALVCIAFVLLVGACAAVLVGSAAELGVAYAAAGIPSKVSFTHGHKVWYGGTGSGSNQGRETHTYHVTYTRDGSEVREVAYCAIPSKNWISEEERPTTPLVGGSAKVNGVDDVAMVLYYGYGGPGFDKSMWPDAYYDGTAMDKEDRYDWSASTDKYYAMTHLLVSDRAYGDDGETLDKCSDKFTKWFAWNIQGNKHWATKYAGKDAANSDSVYNKMKAAWSELSDAFKAEYASSCYAINPHAWGDTGAQIFIVAAKNAPPLGAISLVKKSARASISGDSGCYKLKGALYGVYETEKAAQARKEGKALKTFKTDADGEWASEEEFSPGTYYVAEIAPSTGYALDESVYPVEVKAGKTAKVNGSTGSKEPPVDAPVTILLRKRDADLESDSQGMADLSGATFSVKFFAGYYNASNLPAKAARSWVFETDSSGVVDLGNAAKYKVSGDDLYRNADGRNTLPLGTVSIVETGAPQGYNLGTFDGGNPKTYVFQVVEDSSAKSGARVKPLNYSDVLAEDNTPIIADVVERGDYRLVKEAAVEVREDAPQEQKRILAAGIKFQIVNDNDHPVVSPQTGKALGKGEVVCEITTDADGLASTRGGKATNGWAIPDGWSGALAFGTYIVHEVIPDEVQQDFKAEYGTELLAVDDWKITISGEGQYDPATLVNDRIPQMPLAVAKVDSETGERITAPVSFQLYDGKGKLVTYTSHYPETSVIDTWTANERGELTLPMLLVGGTYTLKEVEAPEGYLLSPEGIEFVVDEYRGWDDPLTVTFPNKPVKGIIELVKSDAQTGEAIAGACYEVVAAGDVITADGTVRAIDGEVVSTLETGANGKAHTGELYLGTYVVRETAPPPGYALDEEEHVVAVASEGQDVAVVTVRADLVDEPTTLRIKKVDARTGSPLAGATFRIWRDDAAGNAETAKGKDGGDAESAGDGSGSGADADADADDGGDDTGSVGSVESTDDADGADGDADADDGSDDSGADDGANYADGVDESVTSSYELVVATDGNGIIELKGLVAGAYHAREVDPPAGYHASDADLQLDFQVNDQGLIGVSGGEFSDTLVLTVENEPNEIKTHASVNGAQIAVAGKNVKVVDKVWYKGCVPGRSYIVKGVLHLAKRAADGSTKDGGVLVSSNGAEATAQTTFVATGVEGEVEVVFAFDASALAGKKVVAFEEMYHEGVLFAVHADIDDDAQVVFFSPEIATKLVSKESGSQLVLAGKGVQLVDTVSYRGLVAGEKYRAIGTLMDKSTHTPLKRADGSTVKASTTFTPKSSAGEVKVTFRLDASALAGHDTVAFETIRRNGREVVAHEDYDAASQTVRFRTPPAPSPPSQNPPTYIPKTGDALSLLGIAFAIVILSATVIALAARAVRRR